jgi:hypothetical protein
MDAARRFHAKSDNVSFDHENGNGDRVTDLNLLATFA